MFLKLSYFIVWHLFLQKSLIILKWNNSCKDQFILTTSSLITEISTVVELVTHPALRNTTATGTRELIATTALVH